MKLGQEKEKKILEKREPEEVEENDMGFDPM